MRSLARQEVPRSRAAPGSCTFAVEHSRVLRPGPQGSRRDASAPHGLACERRPRRERWTTWTAAARGPELPVWRARPRCRTGSTRPARSTPSASWTPPGPCAAGCGYRTVPLGCGGCDPRWPSRSRRWRRRWPRSVGPTGCRSKPSPPGGRLHRLRAQPPASRRFRGKSGALRERHGASGSSLAEHDPRRFRYGEECRRQEAKPISDDAFAQAARLTLAAGRDLLRLTPLRDSPPHAPPPGDGDVLPLAVLVHGSPFHGAFTTEAGGASSVASAPSCSTSTRRS
jgi:hypothetical protein